MNKQFSFITHNNSSEMLDLSRDQAIEECLYYTEITDIFSTSQISDYINDLELNQSKRFGQTSDKPFEITRTS